MRHALEPMKTISEKPLHGSGASPGRLRFAARFLFCLLAGHVFVLLPAFWMELAWWPDQVKVYMVGDGEKPPAIVSNGMEWKGEQKERWPGGRVYRFYLLSGMEWDDLLFRLPEGKGPSDVRRIDLQKWKFLKLEKDGTKLEPAEGASGLWRFGDAGFDRAGFVSWTGVAAFFAVEAALLGLSWLAARLKRTGRGKPLWGRAALAALPLAVLLQVALPLQTYLAHRSSYPFSLAELCAAMAVGFPCFHVLATVAVAVLVRCFGRWMLGMALALAACMYLESGVLSLGLAELSGNRYAFQAMSRALWDAAAWGAVFVLAAVFRRVLDKRCAFVSLVLTALIGAAILDAKPERKADVSKLSVKGFCPVGTAIQSATYSTNRNVMVFILDSLEREAAHDAINDPEAGPGLRGKFPGFTEFPDNVGACSKSLTAVANLLTGRYPGDMAERADFYWSVFSGDSALATYLDAGHDVFATLPALGCGFASRTAEKETARAEKIRPLTCPPSDGQPWTLRDVTHFRVSPYAAKGAYAYYMNLGRIDLDMREWVIYPVLASAPVRPESPGTFLFVHTRGVHDPILYNRHGVFSPDADARGDGAREMAIFLFGELGRLFDAYRERGLYDNSLIMVLADHGQHGGHEIWREGDDRELPRKAKPFLWVKPPGSGHPFETSSVSTSHARIADVLKAAAGRDLGPQELAGMLHSRERLYRWIPLHGNEWRDWVVHGNGDVSFEKADPAPIPPPEGMVPVQCNRIYWLSARKTAQMDATVVLGNIEDLDTPVLPGGQRDMTLDFKAPDAAGRYSLQLGISGTQDGVMLFRQAGRENWVETPFKAGLGATAVLPDVQPNPDGMVRIEGMRRGDAPSGRVSFVNLMLKKAR